MAARIGFRFLLFIDLWQIIKIIPVRLCSSSWICRIVNDDPVHLSERRTRSGKLIWFQKIVLYPGRHERLRLLYCPLLLSFLADTSEHNTYYDKKKDCDTDDHSIQSFPFPADNSFASIPHCNSEPLSLYEYHADGFL